MMTPLALETGAASRLRSRRRRRVTTTTHRCRSDDDIPSADVLRHRLRADRHRPGLRVRLLRHAGLPRAAREGIRVILVNSNPATIMTDPEFADATYIEPITPEFVELIIAKERPDALLPTMGGQTALNVAMALHESGVLGSTAWS
jgi:hypothetical protein